MTNQKQAKAKSVWEHYGSLGASAFALLWVAVPACGGSTETGFDEAGLGRAQFELSTVPANVICLRITATPTTSDGVTSSKLFPVTQGASALGLPFNVLIPAGYSFTGEGFAFACGSIGGNAPNWVADPVVAQVRTGATTNVAFTFRKNNLPTVDANFVGNVLSIALGATGTYVATDTGVVASGSVGFGAYRAFTKLPGTTFDSTVAAGNQITALTATSGGACAARADGTLWCWGTSNQGELGPGIAIGATSTTPVQISALSGVKYLASSALHACALATMSGTTGIYCWGNNASGQLGTGDTVSGSAPRLAYQTPDIRSLSTGQDSSYAVDGSSGLLLSWGGNKYYQLAVGTQTNLTRPTFVATAQVFKAVASGTWHACALGYDASVRCWGRNDYGQLGDGTTVGRWTADLVPDLYATQLWSGTFHSCALTSDGVVKCWGTNDMGQLGDGTTRTRLTPSIVPFPPVTSLPQSPSGTYVSFTCGITSKFEIYCTGSNDSGQLGDGTLFTAYVPQKLSLN